MSLIRQVWLLVLGVIVAATIGSVGASVWTARTYLSTQLTLKNNDNAQSLALALSQSNGDATLVEVTVSALFDTGSYRLVRLRGPEGQLLVDKIARDRRSEAPDWFVRAFPLEVPTGIANVTSGWKQLGTVELASETSYAHEALWDGALRMAGWIAFVGLCAGLIARWGVKRLARPLDAVVAQAGALIQRRFVTIDEPRTPELYRVSRAMNAMVDRVRAMFAEQSDQLESLRKQASADLLTGLAHRVHFLAAVADALQREDGQIHGALFLVRISQLGELNRRFGRACTDEMLKDLAQCLHAEGQGVGAMVGRLNGSDFGLMVPISASVQVAGEALLARLQAVIGPHTAARVVGAGVSCHREDKVGHLLSSLDLALARAEARSGFAFEAAGDAAALNVPLGEEAWRTGLVRAVDERRIKLVAFPVIDGHGQLLHLECPLRIQLLPGGDYEPAARWLPYALRTGQVSRSDEMALRLALEAIAQDGLPRGVNIDDAGFVPRLRALIAAQQTLAKLLWVEVDEAAVDRQPANLEELCRQLRPLGVKVGLEHAGHRIAQLGKVLDAGLDYVKLAGAVVGHVENDEARAAHVRGIASVLHGMGVAVYAEGVSTAGDLAALWRCRIDGVTGPAVHLRT
jgi:EAL domain-containing protein (putative c-di-GMP-specific phosphodiesterase class I)/GGDEF domain-containing protein